MDDESCTDDEFLEEFELLALKRAKMSYDIYVRRLRGLEQEFLPKISEKNRQRAKALIEDDILFKSLQDLEQDWEAAYQHRLAVGWPDPEREAFALSVVLAHLRRRGELAKASPLLKRLSEVVDVLEQSDEGHDVSGYRDLVEELTPLT